MEFFIMTRKGSFRPAKFTNNQCKEPGQTTYNYVLKMVFPKDVEMDSHHFIVDHADVDKMITHLVLEGSCEQMHKRICKAVREFFELRKRDLYGFKCTIVPDVVDPVAILEYTYTKESMSNPALQSVWSLLT